jgi:hypothetical protein
MAQTINGPTSFRGAEYAIKKGALGTLFTCIPLNPA